MNLPPLNKFPHAPGDPRTILARVRQAKGRLRTHELVARIHEKECRQRAAAREMVEALLPDYQDVPLDWRRSAT